MAGEDERLVVALEARVRDFEKNFERAQKTANAKFTAIDKRAEASAANLKAAFSGAGASITSVFSTLGGAGIIAGGGLAGIITTLRSAATSVADLAAEAQKAGVAFEPFQELKYATGQARIGVDALTDGLKEMQLRADEFIRTGAGSSVEAFKRLGYTAADLKKKLADPAALFEEIIDKMKGFSKAGQIRIADEIFGGTGGEQFVRLMEQGEGAISRAREEARALGVILSDDLAAEAKKVAQEFDKLALRIEVALKSGVLEGARALEDYKAELLGIAAAFGAVGAGVVLGPLVASLGAAATAAVATGVQMTALNATILTVAAGSRAAALATAGLAAALRLAGGPWGVAIMAIVGTIAALALRQDHAKVAADAHKEAMSSLDKAISEVKARVPGAEAALKALGDQHVENAEKALADARAELEYARAVAANQKVGGWAGKYGAKMPTANTAEMTAALEGYIKTVELAQQRLDELKGRVSGAPTSAPPAAPDASISAATYGYKDLATASAQRVRDLEVERTALGMTTQAAAEYKFMQQALATAQEHNLKLSPEQVAQLQQLAARYGDVTAAMEKTRASQERLRELQSELGTLATSSIMGLVDGTKTWNDALKDSLKLLADLLLKSVLLGEGPFGNGGGGAIGTIVKSVGGAFGFADGGVMTPQGPRQLKRFASGGVSRKAAIFGEAGPEAAVPLPDGRRIPVDMRMPDTSRIAGNSVFAPRTNNVSVAPTYNITTSGSGATGNTDEIERVLRRSSVDLMRVVKAELLKDMKEMGPLARGIQGRFALNPMRGV
ncbi:hypothetical protein K9U40_09345 [Xanthobacter autotrophicus]|uniref:hypothetical protein n=1 Tax=Xanthobacter TaxID=279 RepID=UPI0024AC13EE|nr:hypothetical protein [Xanthobacter autotrophicus]MDI4664528.1 hypothetical protein [Xanthobacter autotrophicus]